MVTFVFRLRSKIKAACCKVSDLKPILYFRLRASLDSILFAPRVQILKNSKERVWARVLAFLNYCCWPGRQMQHKILWSAGTRLRSVEAQRHGGQRHGGQRHGAVQRGLAARAGQLRPVRHGLVLTTTCLPLLHHTAFSLGLYVCSCSGCLLTAVAAIHRVYVGRDRASGRRVVVKQMVFGGTDLGKVRTKRPGLPPMSFSHAI